MALTINGVKRHIVAMESVTMLLVELGLGAEPTGVAVAVNGVVIPRGQWSAYAIPASATIEIVTATQGG